DSVRNICALFSFILFLHQNRLIHATKKQTIEKYLKGLLLTDEQFKKINQYRRACNLEKIKHVIN
ncbi:hypothetical protein CN445_29310, partial [Bacillus cereus]